MRYLWLMKESKNKELVNQYVTWVNEKGDISPFDSKYLTEFIKCNNYSGAEYEMLAMEMKFIRNNTIVK